MPRNQINELAAFLAVARESSFTKAAGQLGVTPSALSHTIKGLEERLGLRLLARTTRSVAPTDAGQRLMTRIGPLMDQIDAEIVDIGRMRDTPAGMIRISCTDAVIEMVFRERLASFLRTYPDITVELNVDYGLTDIVAGRFDAGVRIGEALEGDMIATRIGPDWRFAVVGAPAYFARRAAPTTPQDLSNHLCIGTRMATSGDILPWEFDAPSGRSLAIRTQGQAVFNTASGVLNGALDGLGLGYVPLDMARLHLKSGALHECLSDWLEELDGFHLYYPSRKQHAPAFSAFLQHFRFSSAV